MEKSNNRSGLIFGSILIALGVLSLMGQILSGAGFWPFIIILVGLAFFGGMVLGGRAYSSLAIPGAIIVGVGLISLVQNTFNLWETWAYAWGLIISAVGLGIVISGAWGGDADLRRRGWKVAEVGFTLFVIFGVIFEFIFYFTGVTNGRGGLLWPILMIVVGLLQLLVRSYRLMRGEAALNEQGRVDTNLFWPVLFMGAGALWLLVSLGWLNVSQLTVLVNLWPLLLIAAGINLFFGRRTQWVNLILGVAVVAGMFGAVYYGPQLGLPTRPNWAVLGVSTISSGPTNQWVNGSGKVATETRQVSDFSRVSLNSVGELEIVQGSQTSLSIEAEDNLLPYLTTEVRGGTLVIDTKRGVGIRPTRTIHYKMTVKNLDSVNVSGAGDITLDKITTDRLDITITGAGKVNATGTANQLSVEINGAGDYKGADLKSSSTDVRISGLGSADVWATNSLSANISGAGTVNYWGNPGDVSKNTSGIGTVRSMGSK